MSKILLVEDDTNLSEIYQARMEAEGYTVVAASDGESALALAAKEKPDLILSDVMMPKISGFEMLDILRNTDGLKHTKVIMLTALGQAEDQARAQSLGADKYLVKSQVTLEDIVSAAQELLNDGGGEQALPTPAELAAPTITAASTSTSSGDDTTASPAIPEPAQPAPTGPLAATVPAIVPVIDTPPVIPTATPPVVATPVAVEPQTEAVSTEVAPLIEVMPQLTQVEQDQQAEEAAVAEAAAVTVQSEPVVEPAPAVEVAASQPAEAPAAEPVATPAIETSAPAPTPTPALVAEPAVVAVDAQPEPAPEVETVPEPQPAVASPVVEVAAPLSAATIDEKVVSNAIDKLLAKSPDANAAAISPTSGDEKPHNKIIAPIAHAPAPSLQELLAKEEAKTAGASVTPIAGSATAVPAPAASPASVPAAADEEAQAAATLAQAQAANKPAKPNEFDPNSISL